MIADRFNVLVFKNGKHKGHQISSTHLNTMLCSEVFLQNFRALDRVITVPMYMPDFSLVAPGYNDGGPGHRYYFAGGPPEISGCLDTIAQFLDVMDFSSTADRTNVVGGALTVALRLTR